MKKSLLTLLILFLFYTSFAQPFAVDKSGYVSNPVFHQLIKERGYELVGRFVTHVVNDNEFMAAEFLKGGKTGYIDTFGNEIKANDPKPHIPAPSKPIKHFFTLFKNNRKYGLKDQFGKIGIPAEYDDIKIYHDSLAFTRSGKKVLAFILYNETVRGVDYSYAVQSVQYSVHPNGEFSYISFFPELYLKRSNGKFALFNSKGDALTPFIYDHISWDKDAEACLVEVGHFPKIKQGLIDSTGKVLLEPGTEATSVEIRKYNTYRVIFVSRNDLGNIKSGLYIRRLNILTPLMYSEINDFYNGLARVTIGKGDDRKYGVIDTLGNEVVKAQYDYIRYPGKSTAVFLNGKAGLINLKGRLVLPVIYDDIFEWDKLFYVKKDGKIGIADSTGKFIFPILYDYIYQSHKKNNLIYSLNKKVGIMTKKGKVILPPTYDKIDELDSVTAIVTLNNKYGLLSNRKLMVPLKYNDIIPTGSAMYIVESGNKYGIIDESGVLIIPLKYDKIYPPFKGEPAFEHYNGIFKSVLNGRDCSIDLYGNENPEIRYAHWFM